MPLSALALCLLLPLSAVTGASQQDADLTASLAPHTGIFDEVSLRVEEGTAVLTGRVVSVQTKNALGLRVRRLPGVAAVRNDIVVLPHSAEDDGLRYRIARAIYGHPAFWAHAARTNPPVRIIVESGHVTLAGVVGSASERALARSLATGLGERTLTSRIRLRGEVP